MSVLVILPNMFSNTQAKKAASGFCKTLNHRSHEHGIRGQEDLCATVLGWLYDAGNCQGVCLRKVSQKSQTGVTPLPWVLGGPSEQDLCCNSGDAPGQEEHSWGPRAASTSDVLHGDTKCVPRQKTQGHPGCMKGHVTKPGVRSGCWEVGHSTPSSASGTVLPTQPRDVSDNQQAGQTLAWFPSSHSHSACTKRSCPKKFIQILFACLSSRLRLSFSAGYTFLEAFYWSLL